MSNTYVIVKDRHPRISEVLNDCVQLCVPTSNGESLGSILQKICSKIESVTYTFQDSSTIDFQVNGNTVTAHVITGGGSVTSVGLSDITSFAVATGSPVTTSGNLGYTLSSQSANRVFAGPTVGGAAVPTFRQLVVADIPDLSGTYLTAVPINILQGATGTNTISNGTQAQAWNWPTLAGNTALALGSTSTAAAGNLQRLFSATLSGSNTNNNQITEAARFVNTHSGTGSTNRGIFVEASGGTNNYAAYIKSAIRITPDDTNFLDIIGGNPSSIDTGITLTVSTASLNHLVMNQFGLIVNPNAVRTVGALFRVGGDADNHLIVADYDTQRVGINVTAATRTHEIHTKYDDVDPDETFYAQRLVARGYGLHIPVAVGFGVGEEYAVENSTGVYKVVGSEQWVYTDKNNGSEDADYILSIITAGSLSEKFRILSTGALRASEYGAGTFTGTATFNLSVDTNGNVIETALGGGSSITSDTFNATSDWTGPSGGFYSFAFTHSLGTNNISVTVWDETSTPTQVFPDIVEQTNNNTLTIKVPDSPDGRFAGRVTIVS